MLPMLFKNGENAWATCGGKGTISSPCRQQLHGKQRATSSSLVLIPPTKQIPAHSHTGTQNRGFKFWDAHWQLKIFSSVSATKNKKKASSLHRVNDEATHYLPQTITVSLLLSTRLTGHDTGSWEQTAMSGAPWSPGLSTCDGTQSYLSTEGVKILLSLWLPRQFH